MINLTREEAQRLIDALLAWEEECSGCGWSKNDEECVALLRAKLSEYPENFIDALKFHTAMQELEPEPVGNTLTFMTRAIFNVIAKYQEINGGYFIADGDIDDFIERLAKVINSTFEPLKPKNTAPPQREWVGLTDEERTYLAWESNNGPHCVAMTEAKLKEKNNG